MFWVHWQAAGYGRAFVPADALAKDAIVLVARKLRILNALHDPEARSFFHRGNLRCRSLFPCRDARMMHV